MEKAILKTLSYADIFEYPLKSWEIHKWLILKNADFPTLQTALNKLLKEDLVGKKDDFYFLKGRQNLIQKRLSKEKFSRIYFQRANLITGFIKLIPWVKLVGVSGGLAMDNAGREDDIDLLIVSAKERLWLTRLLTLIILAASGKRRSRQDSKMSSGGKFCANIFLDEEHLAQENQNIYLAHEVLQMKPLWQKHDVYAKYLEDNSWAFKFLPNWSSAVKRTKGVESRKQGEGIFSFIFDLFEKLARLYQLKYMGKASGKEKILPGALYFHPDDYSENILRKYQQKLSILDKRQ